MTETRLEYLSAATLLVVCLLVGFPVAFHGEQLLAVPGWVWWSCYGGYLLTLVGLMLSEGYWTQRTRRIALPSSIMLLVGLSAGVVLVAPGAGWTPILLVITTAVAAQLHGLRLALAVLVINSVLAMLAGLLGSASVPDAAFGGVLYAGLQALCVWAVYSHVQESKARKELAATNVELRGATALLAESSRSNERLRIARELHDLVGHQLTALTLELEVAVHRATPPADEHVKRSRDLAKELLNDVRSAVGELRTQSPELATALRDLAAQVPRPQVHLELEDGLAPDEEATTALIRGAQEAVTNAIRHAEAENVWIAVRSGNVISDHPNGSTSGLGGLSSDGGSDRGKALVLDARDDGQGNTAFELGNGLRGLTERVELLGGTVTFDTTDGFRVTAHIPQGAPS